MKKGSVHCRLAVKSCMAFAPSSCQDQHSSVRQQLTVSHFFGYIPRDNLPTPKLTPVTKIACNRNMGLINSSQEKRSVS